MKAKRLNDLRSKTVKELEKMVFDMKKDLLKVEVTLATGEQKNLKGAKNLKKDIAQILTIAREKEITERESKEKTKN